LKSTFISTYVLIIIVLGAVSLQSVSISQIWASVPSGAAAPTDCPQGFEGSQPNCFPIGAQPQVPFKCKEGFTGSPPNCEPESALASPPSEECPEGTTGTPPNCEPVVLTEEEPQSPPAEEEPQSPPPEPADQAPDGGGDEGGGDEGGEDDGGGDDGGGDDGGEGG
jgi:hypothetical protein